MQVSNLSAEAVGVAAGAYLVESGHTLLGVVWLVVAVGLILRKTTGGGRE